MRHSIATPSARARRAMTIPLTVTLLALTLAATATPARAVADFDENFDALSLGELSGQNGWVCTPGKVAIVKGPGVDTTHTAHGPSLVAISEAERLLATPFHYTVADTAIVWSVQAIMGGAGGNKDALGGPSGHVAAGNGEVFGMERSGGAFPTTLLSCTGTSLGDTLQFAHWYELRVVVNFSVAGGRATLSYRDLTLAQSTFTVDKTLRNVNLGATTEAGGTYLFTSVYIRQDDQDGGGCYIDRLHVGAPGSSATGVVPPAAPAGWALAVTPDPARVADLRFTLPERAGTRLAAFDVRGRRVRTFEDGMLEAGVHHQRWDFTGSHGEPLAAGVYYLRLESDGRVLRSRVVHIR